MMAMATCDMPQSTATAPSSSTIKDLESYNRFSKRFVKKKVLGEGSDGVVKSYVDQLGLEVAVKTPRNESRDYLESFKDEVQSLKAIGTHDHIVGMMALCEDFQPIAPGIFFQVCNLGDLHVYWYKLYQQEYVTKHSSPRIPEITVLKLLRDISLGLDFLHNGNTHGFVHGDIKPGTILVSTPPGYTAGDVPSEPIFKITDFGRASVYPTPASYMSRKTGYRGTYEYAPPMTEQTDMIKPSVDMWALGSTIQFFTLGMEPIQSRAAVINERQHNGECCPEIDDDETWNSEYWRSRRIVTFRPVNMTREELVKNWDINENDPEHVNLHFHTPYSDFVNICYTMLLDADPESRVTSAHLRKYVVPLVERRILMERKLALAVDGFNKALSLRDSACGRPTEEKLSSCKSQGMGSIF
jgi:serine/threonine protein kinase